MAILRQDVGYTQRRSDRGAARRPRLGHWLAPLLAVALWAVLLTTPGSAPLRRQAQQNHARLDAELRHARHDLGLPASMLAGITDAERRVSAGRVLNANDATSAGYYAQLYTQLVAIEASSTSTLQAQTQTDLLNYMATLDQRRSQNVSILSPYQARLDAFQATLTTTTTAAGYAQLDSAITAQNAALQALLPAYEKLQDFDALLRALRAGGTPASLGELAYAQDLQTLESGAAPARLTALTGVIGAQTQQALTGDLAALPTAGPARLKAFQTRIDLLRQNGEATSAATFQRQHDADARTLATAQSATDDLALAAALATQTQAMTLPLLRAGARHDLATLAALIASAQRRSIVDPYNGLRFPAAYEYADTTLGYGAVRDELDAAIKANTVADLEKADGDIVVMMTNLRAMLDNMGNGTPPGQPHATDLRLMGDYGVLRGKTIVVSLREQAARLYDNGKLVYWSLVTTGRIELPSPPGLHVAMSKGSPILFVSPEPRSSPFWFEPTPVNYGIAYADGGYFLHDANWRSGFGPGTNLPHYDPIAFNGGSHGCVNFPEDKMKWIYNWTPVGTPVIVY